MKRGYKESRKERMNILHTVQRRKVNWIGHILRGNGLLKHIIEREIEGRVEVAGRRGRRCTQLLVDLQEKRRYWKLKVEALDRIPWGTGFGTSCGPHVRQTTE
jgi:hypothetical protein